MAKRRGHGEGSIYQRKKDGRWVGQVIVGYKSNGKPKRVTFYGKSKKEVQKKIDEAKYQINNGTFAESTKLKTGEWLDIWLKEYAKLRVRPATWQNYEMMI